MSDQLNQQDADEFLSALVGIGFLEVEERDGVTTYHETDAMREAEAAGRSVGECITDGAAEAAVELYVAAGLLTASEQGGVTVYARAAERWDDFQRWLEGGGSEESWLARHGVVIEECHRWLGLDPGLARPSGG